MNIAQEDGVKERGREGSGQIHFPNPASVTGIQSQVIFQNPCKGRMVRACVEIRARCVAQAFRELIQQGPVFHQIEGTGKTGKNGGIQNEGRGW
jgi:hypothetical protein